MLAWPSYNIIRHTQLTISAASLSTENYLICRTKLFSFRRRYTTVGNIFLLWRWPKKTLKIQIYRSWSVILYYKGHKRSHRLMQKYECINVYLHFVKSLKCHICYTDLRFFCIVNLSLLLTRGFAGQSYWPNLCHGSKSWEHLCSHCGEKYISASTRYLTVFF